MGVRTLIRAAVGAAVLAAPGCVTPQKTDATKTAPAGDPQTGVSSAAAVPTPPKAATPAKVDGNVKPASFHMPSLGKLTGKDRPGPAASLVMVGWRKRVEYLPDPTKNGTMSPGLVGEMFLVAGNGQFPTPNGPLTVEMFDETPRPGYNPQQPPKIGQWRFEKEVLRQLATPHEWFGKCYALFLPWPEYKPDVAKVRLVVRYEPEGGIPLYAEPHVMVLDNGPPPGTPGPLPSGLGSGPFAGGPSPMGGPPPAHLAGLGLGAPPANAVPTMPQMTLPPGGLPPIVITRTPGQ